MNNKGLFKVFFGGMSVCMITIVIVTSMHSNILEAVPRLNQEPWFVTTMLDFYFNIAILSAWVLYKEKSAGAAALWIIGFVSLGSIATAAYVLTQLIKSKNEPLEAIFRKA